MWLGRQTEDCLGSKDWQEWQPWNIAQGKSTAGRFNIARETGQGEKYLKYPTLNSNACNRWLSPKHSKHRPGIYAAFSLLESCLLHNCLLPWLLQWKDAIVSKVGGSQGEELLLWGTILRSAHNLPCEKTITRKTVCRAKKRRNCCNTVGQGLDLADLSWLTCICWCQGVGVKPCVIYDAINCYQCAVFLDLGHMTCEYVLILTEF